MAERALYFVHRGVDVENQWSNALISMRDMSNLELALVWKRLSETVPFDDLRLHYEYKCLYKQAVREVERGAFGGKGACTECSKGNDGLCGCHCDDGSRVCPHHGIDVCRRRTESIFRYSTEGAPNTTVITDSGVGHKWMLAGKALFFVHKGMDLEQQWRKAVSAFEEMSNMEIALAWQWLSGLVQHGDFKTHSEYKCLYKRAYLEAGRGDCSVLINYPLVDRNKYHSGDFNGDDSISYTGSVKYEFPLDPPSAVNQRRALLDSLHDQNSNGKSQAERIADYTTFLVQLLEKGWNGNNISDYRGNVDGARAVAPIGGVKEENKMEYFKRVIEFLETELKDGAMRNTLVEKVKQMMDEVKENTSPPLTSAYRLI
jgi:hypothetical protein